MLTALWFLWNERNTVREAGRWRPAETIARAIRIYVGEMAATNSAQQKKPIRRVQRWSKPPDDFLKVNCDASFTPGDRSGGWGFLIRDSDGDVVLNGWGRVNHLLSAGHAETIACLQGVQAAISLGIGRLILETDALNVKLALSAEDQDRSVIGGLIEELKFIVATNFISFECVYV